MAQLASDIVSKTSKYIHPSRAEEVEMMLLKLQKKYLENENSRQSSEAEEKKSQREEKEDNSAKSGKEKQRKSKDGDRDADRISDTRGTRESALSGPKEDELEANLLPPARIEDLDDYLDLLYQVSSGTSEKEREEGIAAQIRGTGMVLQLCRSVANLENLVQNKTVMSALTRVLKDESKKSVDLTYNILRFNTCDFDCERIHSDHFRFFRIFLAFSNFAEMHALMMDSYIGMHTMKVSEK